MYINHIFKKMYEQETPNITRNETDFFLTNIMETIEYVSDINIFGNLQRPHNGEKRIGLI